MEVGAAPPGGSAHHRQGKYSARKQERLSLKHSSCRRGARHAAARNGTPGWARAAAPVLLRGVPSASASNAPERPPRPTSPSAKITAVRVPKLPRREGEYLTTATIELSNDGQIVARIPLSLSLEISASAAVPAVGKGTRVQLMIESGPARITATAVALSDGELGDTLQFRVASTMKILYGKLESPTLARVVQ